MKHINIDIQNVYEYGHDNSPIHMVVPTVPPWNESTYLFKPHWLQYPARVKTSIVEFGSATTQLAKKEFALFESIVDKDIFCFAKYNIFLGYGLGTHAGEVISAYDLQGYRCDNGFTFTLGNHFNNRAIATGGEVKQLGKELEYLLSFVELANAFAHCKNVELIDQPLTRQQRRRKERKGETFYKVLAIEPFNKQKEMLILVAVATKRIGDCIYAGVTLQPTLRISRFLASMLALFGYLCTFGATRQQARL